MSASRNLQRGFTLVELMVAVVVGMALTLAITTIMTRYESGRRVLTASNDLSLTSAYLSFELDRQLRSAGSGYAQGSELFGCMLRVSRSGAVILPRPGTFPAPFNTVDTSPRLIPLVIHAGAGTGGSDVLAVMTGASALGETGIDIKPTSTTDTSLRLQNTVGIVGNDLVLVGEPALGCMVQQVAANFVGGATELLSLAGDYAAAQSGTLRLTDFSTNADPTKAFVLGNTVGRPPQLQLIGVGANATLVSLDMLKLDNTDTVLPLANGVLDLRALYGVDSDADGSVDSWVAPGAANFTAAALTDGSAAAQTRLRSILAVRVGVILRSDRVEKEAVSPTTVVLFSDLAAGVQHTRTLSADERYQRIRGVEFTVPLRNMMLSSRQAL